MSRLAGLPLVAALLVVLPLDGIAQTPARAAAQPSFAQIDQIMNQAVAEKKFPGGVVIVGHGGHVVFHKAYGHRALGDHPEAMTEDTVFDLASLTKVLATAPSVMELYQQGRFRLNDPVAKYLPDFAAEGKGDITIRDLLTHYSGLAPDLDLKPAWEGKGEAFRQAYASKPMTPPGVQFRYSDINFITLGALVEKLSGMPEDEYVAKYVTTPLGMRHTRYLPPEEWRAKIAPTQHDEHGVMLRGVVHDPTARRMGGVAGHAGLFSTASDVAIYAQNLLNRLAGRPSKFPLSQLTLEKMTTPEQPATAVAMRGLGWDIDTPFSGNRGELFPVGSFGHTGFTGTSLWMDPASDTYVVMLTNAVYPDGGVVTTPIRAAVSTAAAEAVGVRDDGGERAANLTGYNESLAGMRRRPDRNGAVKMGLDVLEAEQFHTLKTLAEAHGGQLRLGLLTNQTGLDAEGRRTIDVLAKDAAETVPGLKLTTLFSPEHGIAGALDKEGIGNTTDAATGIPVISLYGAKPEERRPSLDVLRNLDAVVIDLQDAGVRFYTYEAVTRYFLEAAAQTKTPIIVLDRPAPVGGSYVQGPVSDAGLESYVNVAPVPARHGLTLGELARYLNGELKLNAPLTVVAMQGWQRGDWFDDTGLAWTNPSPNLRSERAATLYPGIGLIETTNLSVGRGTDTPFEQVGAAWIDEPGAVKLAHVLNARDLPGVRFMPVSFTPEKPYPYAGELCHGIAMTVTDRNQLDAPEMGIEIVSAVRKLYPQQLHIEKIETLLANKATLEALEAGKDPQHIAEDWREGIEAFEAKRKQYLLY